MSSFHSLLILNVFTYEFYSYLKKKHSPIKKRFWISANGRSFQTHIYSIIGVLTSTLVFKILLELFHFLISLLINATFKNIN